MNARIKSLIDQATVWEGMENGYIFDKEKFAELIVRDCLKIVNRHEYSYHEADPLWETSQLIKEHFGVDK